MSPEEKREFHNRFASRFREARKSSASSEELAQFQKEDEIFSHLPKESQDIANEQLVSGLIARFQPFNAI